MCPSSDNAASALTQLIPLSTELSLVPVVEFSPGHYARQERPTPQGSGAEAPEAWELYWRECLSDAGIHGLVPLRPASWLVPTERLTDPHVLRQLIRAQFTNRPFFGNAKSPEEITTPLEGGYALLDAGQLVIEPRCCGDLGNLASWRDAAEGRTDDFWIGHPMLLASMRGEQLTLKEDPTEHSGDEPLRVWLLSPDALAQALSSALREQEAFAHRLEQILEEQVDSDLAHLFAQHLAGAKAS